MNVKNLTIGEKIRTFRLRAELSQAELGKKIGVHGNTVCRWEKGERTNDIRLSMLRKISKALNISLEDLVLQRTKVA